MPTFCMVCDGVVNDCYESNCGCWREQWCEDCVDEIEGTGKCQHCDVSCRDCVVVTDKHEFHKCSVPHCPLNDFVSKHTCEMCWRGFCHEHKLSTDAGNNGIFGYHKLQTERRSCGHRACVLCPANSCLQCEHTKKTQQADLRAAQAHIEKLTELRDQLGKQRRDAENIEQLTSTVQTEALKSALEVSKAAVEKTEKSYQAKRATFEKKQSNGKFSFPVLYPGVYKIMWKYWRARGKNVEQEDPMLGLFVMEEVRQAASSPGLRLSGRIFREMYYRLLGLEAAANKEKQLRFPDLLNFRGAFARDAMQHWLDDRHLAAQTAPRNVKLSEWPDCGYLAKSLNRTNPVTGDCRIFDALSFTEDPIEKSVPNEKSAPNADQETVPEAADESGAVEQSDLLEKSGVGSMSVKNHRFSGTGDLRYEVARAYAAHPKFQHVNTSNNMGQTPLMKLLSTEHAEHFFAIFPVIQPLVVHPRFDPQLNLAKAAKDGKTGLYLLCAMRHKLPKPADPLNTPAFAFAFKILYWSCFSRDCSKPKNSPFAAGNGDAGAVSADKESRDISSAVQQSAAPSRKNSSNKLKPADSSSGAAGKSNTKEPEGGSNQGVVSASPADFRTDQGDNLLTIAVSLAGAISDVPGDVEMCRHNMLKIALDLIFTRGFGDVHNVPGTSHVRVGDSAASSDVPESSSASDTKTSCRLLEQGHEGKTVLHWARSCGAEGLAALFSTDYPMTCQSYSNDDHYYIDSAVAVALRELGISTDTVRRVTGKWRDAGVCEQLAKLKDYDGKTVAW